jgi:hypothetical protein
MKTLQNIVVKASISADVFLPMLARCKTLEIPQSCYIRGLIKDDLTHANNRRSQLERDSPKRGHKVAQYTPSRRATCGFRIRS